MLLGLAAAAFVAGRRLGRRQPAGIRPALRGTEAELQQLSHEVELRFSRQLSQLDRLIVAGDCEIARLQRLSASGRLARGSVMNGRTREPDLVMDDEPVILKGPFAEPRQRKRAA